MTPHTLGSCAFHGDPRLKEFYVTRLTAHAEADNFATRHHWDEGRGCPIGCTLHDFDHEGYETQLGISLELAYVQDHLGMGMSASDAKAFVVQFLEVIPVGADLSRIISQFLVWLLEQSQLEGAEAKGAVAALYRRRLAGDEPTQEEWVAARAAAEIARPRGPGRRPSPASYAAWAGADATKVENAGLSAKLEAMLVARAEIEPPPAPLGPRPTRTYTTIWEWESKASPEEEAWDKAYREIQKIEDTLRTQMQSFAEEECRKLGSHLLTLLTTAPVFSEQECAARRPNPMPQPWLIVEPEETPIEQNVMRLDVPYEQERTMARRIRTKEIKKLLFYGDHIQIWSNDPIAVSNRAMIQVFLDALAQAEGMGAIPGCLTTNMEIHFKGRGKTRRRRKPIKLQFNPSLVSLCFGPRFHQALAFLGEYRARQLKIIIGQSRAGISGILFVGGPTSGSKVTDAGELQEILTALCHLDGNAFAYTNMEARKFAVFLFSNAASPILRLPVIEIYTESIKLLPEVLRRYLEDY